MMLTSGSTPPTRDISAGWSTDESLRSRVASTLRMISGDVRSMTAIRWATSACCSGGSPDSRSDALSAVMCASTSAITCGCSSAMKERSWAGSARCRNWNGILIAAALSRSTISDARSVPSDCSRSCWAYARPPWATCARAVSRSRNSVSTDSVSSALIASSRAISAETSSTSVSFRWPRTDAAFSLPSWIRRMAALRAPIVAMAGALTSPPAIRAGGLRRPRADARPGRRARHASRRSPSRSARCSAMVAGDASRADLVLGGGQPLGLLLPQLLDDVRRGLLARLVAAAALEPDDQEQDGDEQAQAGLADQVHPLGVLVGGRCRLELLRGGGLGGAVERHGGRPRPCRRASCRCRRLPRSCSRARPGRCCGRPRCRGSRRRRCWTREPGALSRRSTTLSTGLSRVADRFS